MAQFRELQAFAQFGTSDLDAATRHQLERGLRLNRLLVQPENQPLPLGKQVVGLFAALNGYLDDVAVNKVADFEQALHGYMESSHPQILESITSSGEISEETAEALRAALKAFKESVPF